MQTFLPFESFAKSAAFLDNKRLGKQIVEAKQILNTLSKPEYNPETGKLTPWRHHPAVLMWAGFEDWLSFYARCMIGEWKLRGFKTSLEHYFEPMQQSDCPKWLGRQDFHTSHQSNLIRKSPEHYGPLFPGVPSDIPYVWPVTIKDLALSY